MPAGERGERFAGLALIEISLEHPLQQNRHFAEGNALEYVFCDSRACAATAAENRRASGSSSGSRSKTGRLRAGAGYPGSERTERSTHAGIRQAIRPGPGRGAETR